MARISMRNVQKSTVEEYFNLYLSSAAAKGVKDKTLETYKNHFRSISKRMNTTIPMNRLTSQDLENMILKMREEGLSASSINSYTRTLKVFFSWCNEEGHTSLNIKLYKAPETVKEVYTDEELMILLKKPEANCNFCEYRNWVIINFLLNSGCRAATVRNIQIQDVDLARKQIVLRHTKNGKVQVIPLCSSMVAILRDYMAVRGGSGSDWLFCNEFGDFLTENALRLAIVKYNNTRGVERTSIHAFRHTFARKYLVDCGGDAFSLQRLMGHSTLKMTRHYSQLELAKMVGLSQQHLAHVESGKRSIGLRGLMKMRCALNFTMSEFEAYIDNPGAEIAVATLDDIADIQNLDVQLSDKVLTMAIQEQQVYVLKAPWAVVGVCCFSIFQNEPYLNSFYVDQDYRKQGCDKELLAFWEDTMKEQGYESVLLSTPSDDTAKYFYEKLGYQFVGSVQAQTRDSEVLMYRKYLFEQL